MPKEKDKDTWIVRCPKCGRITRACKHITSEDVARIKRLLSEGVEVFESEAEYREWEAGVEFGEIPRAHLYTMMEPRASLGDVVLAPPTRESIEDALVELRHKKLIFGRWGLADVVRKSKGVSLLFVGQPGTGKTLTAEAIARELGRPLMIVNYAHLENMWVGETEKNIEAVFKDAKESGAVLFFDEADAVFHRRGHTAMPWTNRDVNVLLKRLEDFPGVVILSSNMSRVMDKALDRRIDIAVEFEMPDARMREMIFRKLVPKRAPLGEDVDFTELARRFELSGGGILNVVRQAMRAAARAKRRRRITMAHFVRAAEKESQKGRMMGKDYLGSARQTPKERIGGYA
jgi:SpoVK/Ycf46/Vps4 family AAA+-type ATPase